MKTTLSELSDRLKNNTYGSLIIVLDSANYKEISDREATEFADIIRCNEDIIEFSLLNNESAFITVTGTQYLSSALAINTALKVIKLEHLLIDETVTKNLINLLIDNDSLTEFSIQGSTLSNSVLEKLVSNLKVSTNLIRFNCIDLVSVDETELNLVDYFESNLANNYTLLELQGVSSPSIQHYLNRNQEIHKLVRGLMTTFPDPANLDKLELNSQLINLEKLVPALADNENKLANDHCLAETYRLINALHHISLGKHNQAKRLLTTEFSYSNLQEGADRIKVYLNSLDSKSTKKTSYSFCFKCLLGFSALTIGGGLIVVAFLSLPPIGLIATGMGALTASSISIATLFGGSLFCVGGGLMIHDKCNKSVVEGNKPQKDYWSM